MAKFVGLCNLHGSPEFGEMSKNRAVASVSFLGRYALIDIALSNFVNSGIDVVDILIEKHIKSILGHVGTLQTWNENTKIGKDRVMFNEPAINKKSANTDINNLLENPWLLYSDVDYAVVSSGHILMRFNYRPLLQLVEKEEKDLVLIYSSIKDADKAFLKGDVVTLKDNKITSIRKNNGKEKERDVFTESYVISMKLLKEIVNEAKEKKSSDNLLTIIKRKINNKEVTAYGYKYEGYLRNFDSFEHYKEYSLELNDKKPCDALFAHESFYTPTHDTPPARYDEFADVKDSFIANGCIINGKVSGSILGRNVTIEKGAVVKNSIVLAGTTIKAKAKIEEAVVDKFVIVNERKEVVGTKEKPVYVAKGVII